MKGLLVLAAVLAPFVVQDEPKKDPDRAEIGKRAPVFRLNDHTGTAVLVGGEGEHWTVLSFVPKAATPG